MRLSDMFGCKSIHYRYFRSDLCSSILKTIIILANYYLISVSFSFIVIKKEKKSILSNEKNH